MKREKRVSLLWSVVVAFCIGYGGLSCLITAFSFQTDTMGLAIFCGVFAVLAGLLSGSRKGNLGLALLLALTGGSLWHFGTLERSLESLLYRITTLYDMAYDCGRLSWNTALPAGPVGLALGAVGTMVIWMAAYTVVRRRPAIGAVTVGLVPLFACLVVTDTVPSDGSLFLLIFGLLLLILTQTLRRRSQTDGNRLTAILLVPALLCTSLLFWAVPREDYRGPQPMPQWIGSLFLQITTGSGNGVPRETVDLAGIGPRPDIGYAVMEVSSQQGGVMYLRGQSFDTYTGASWEISTAADGADPYWPTLGLQNGGLITIHLRMETDRQYLPYYTDRLTKLEYGRYENRGSRTYSLKRLIPVPGGQGMSITVKQDELVTQCLQLPESTKAWAERYVDRLITSPDLTAAEKAEIIGDFVKGSALYDKQTAKMPTGKTDFTRWFLEESDTGYCVHFATAATVLLRAAGIPARYVTGYMANIGTVPTNVLADDSHAWVEYLDYQRGWVILDATPPEPEIIPTDPTVPAEDVTDPTQTTDPAVPTIATNPTGTWETQETATASTASADSTAGGQEQTRNSKLLQACLLVLLCAVLFAAVLWGQYILRLRLRRRQRRGDPNQQALALWKEIVYFSKLYRLPLPEELIALAEKAKFSQHRLTGPEYRQFKTRMRELSAVLYEKPWYQRLLWKILFAAE